MAQKKHEKQLKALRYWEDEILSHPSQNKYRTGYIKDQISCLTRKLKDTGLYNYRLCAMCGLGFIKSEIDQELCPHCRTAFSGVMISVRELSSTILQVGVSFGNAARSINSFPNIIKE